MAVCERLQHIFEKPLPENPTLLESLSSWNQIKPVKPMEQSSLTVKPMEQSSLTEIFSELHFKENPQSPSSSSLTTSSFLDLNLEARTTRLDKNDFLEVVKKGPSILDPVSGTSMKNHQYTGCHKNGDGFSRMNCESLQLCTEGLGFESSDDVEGLKNGMNDDDWRYQEEKVRITRRSVPEDLSRPRSSGRAFPPPISCIGRTGKPKVIFKSYRHDGRFVLKEVRMPTLEFLHACREDGRLTLQFVHPSDETIDEGDEEEIEEDYEDDAQEESEEENGNNDDDE